MDEYRDLEVGDEVEFLHDVELIPDELIATEGTRGWIAEVGMEGEVQVSVFGSGVFSVFDHHLQRVEW